MTEAAILAILQALTSAIPAAVKLVEGFQAISGPSDQLEAALAALQAANDAAFPITDARLIAADTTV